MAGAGLASINVSTPTAGGRPAPGRDTLRSPSGRSSPRMERVWWRGSGNGLQTVRTRLRLMGKIKMQPRQPQRKLTLSEFDLVDNLRERRERREREREKER